MYCPNDCGCLLERMDSGEPDYEPLDEWWCITCQQMFEWDDLFSDNPFEQGRRNLDNRRV